MNTNDVLNAQQAADLLGAHVETIRRMARKGTIPAFKVGKDWRFRRSSLLTWSDTNPEIKRDVSLLVVDDDAGVCKLIRKILEPQGYRVMTAPNGMEGMDIIQSARVNLVLLDLEMPLMNGPAFIQALKKAGRDIPVIIVTAHPDSQLLMEAFQFGPLTLIPKPVDKNMLLSAVTMTLTGAMNEQDSF